MIYPDTQVRRVSPHIGDGVFATAPIGRGTIVWTQDCFDQVWSRSSVLQLSAPQRSILERFAHLDALRNYILCWDAGRLINHSCEPNLRGVGTWFQVARRDIAAGEELTCDYAECNIDPELDCECGTPACRRKIHSRDLLRFATAWDREAQDLLNLISSLAQPLLPYLLDPAELDRWLARPASLPSFVQFCAFPEESP